MSIKTSKRIALGVIASLVFAPFAAIAPASAANKAISVISMTPDATNTNATGANQTIDILGSTNSVALVATDTVSFTISLTVPTGSAVTLANADGAAGGLTTAYSKGTAAASLQAGANENITVSGSRVTLTANAGVAAFTEVDLGAFVFNPDVVGTYTFIVNSTDADGVPTGASVTRSIVISAPVTTVNAAINNSSKYELGTRVANATKVAVGGAVCYVDTTSAALSSRVNYAEYVHSSITADDYALAFRAPNATYVANGVTLRMSISGPAIWDTGLARNAADGANVATGTLSNSLRTVDFSSVEADKLVADGQLKFTVTGTGTVTISITEIVTATGVTRSGGSLTLDAVTTCTAGVYAASESGVRTQTNDTALTEKPLADVSGASTLGRGATGFIALYLADANGTRVTTDPTLSVTATSVAAVTLGWGGVGTSASATITGANASNAVLFVRAATTGTILTAPIEIKVNGVLLATKNLSFTGAADKITISAKKISVPTGVATADAFKYAVSDSAGNRIASSASVFTVDGTYVTSATAAAGSATAASGVEVTCSALRGKGSVTLAWGLLGDKREVVEVICAGGIATFEVTTSKSSYERSEIGVLTISAKDLAGNPVPDGTDLATAAGKIQFTGSGATLAKSPAATDEFVDGKIDYAFTTSATAGSYNFALWHGDLSPAVTKIASFAVNAAPVPPVVVPPVAPTLTGSLNGRVLLFGSCQADEGDLIVYVKNPGKPWQERAKTFECAAGEFDGSIRAPKSTKFYRVKQEGTGLWSSSVLIRR